MFKTIEAIAVFSCLLNIPIAAGGSTSTLTAGLQAWWSFDDANVTSIGPAGTDIYPGTTATGDGGKIVAGLKNGGRHFDGSSCVTLGNVLNKGTEDFSMSIWVRSEGNGHARPWSKAGGWNAESAGYGFQISSEFPYFRLVPHRTERMSPNYDGGIVKHTTYYNVQLLAYAAPFVGIQSNPKHSSQLELTKKTQLIHSISNH